MQEPKVTWVDVFTVAAEELASSFEALANGNVPAAQEHLKAARAANELAKTLDD